MRMPLCKARISSILKRLDYGDIVWQEILYCEVWQQNLKYQQLLFGRELFIRIRIKLNMELTIKVIVHQIWQTDPTQKGENFLKNTGVRVHKAIFGSKSHQQIT